MSLVLALLLDAIFGEPKLLWDRVPHPAVLMGRVVGWLDTQFNDGSNRKAKGLAVMAGMALSAFALGQALAALPGWWIETLIAAMLFAQKSLVTHIRAVANAQRISLGDGRRAVAMIVSRDTREMDQSAVARSAIESGAENLSDGLIAPAFWFLIGGLPGLLVYKITNTADSMIGYRTPRHEDFGWAAARFDDLLNLIPARGTAALFWLAGGARAHWPDIIADARLHKSPNAGWPEAALSRSIDTALAGPRSYDGTVQDFPFVNSAGQRDLGPDQIDAAIAHIWRVWGLALALAIMIALI